jgi:hypothetical protein
MGGKKLVTKITEDEQNRVHAEASLIVAETQSHREIQKNSVQQISHSYKL